MENFELPIHYKGRDYVFPAKIVRYGYNYKILVEINSTELFFERDEECNWRVILEQEPVRPSLDKELIREMLQCLEQVSP